MKLKIPTMRLLSAADTADGKSPGKRDLRSRPRRKVQRESLPVAGPGSLEGRVVSRLEGERKGGGDSLALKVLDRNTQF